LSVSHAVYRLVIGDRTEETSTDSIIQTKTDRNCSVCLTYQAENYACVDRT